MMPALSRICVASIRYFYPEAVIKLFPGRKAGPWLAPRELARHWAVGVADIAPGDYGWGFVKLEPLFGPAGERFLVVNSDTVFSTGPVLDAFATSAADFLVDDEQQSEADTRQALLRLAQGRRSIRWRARRNSFSIAGNGSARPAS